MAQTYTTARFYDLVWPHRAMLLRNARILCGDATEAEDVAQESMLKAYKALDRVEGQTDVRAWLRTILRNTWIDRWRSRSSRAGDLSLEEIELDPADPSASPEQRPDAAGAWHNPREILDAFSDQQVIDALQELPHEIRWTLLLVDVEGLDQQAAAGVLDVPLGTVKSRLHRGRRMLREALEPLARDLRLLKGT